MVVSLADRRYAGRERRRSRVRQAKHANDTTHDQEKPPAKRRNPRSALGTKWEEDGQCCGDAKETKHHVMPAIHPATPDP